MKSNGVGRAASASVSTVSVSSRRLFSSSKRCRETIPNGSLRQREGQDRRTARARGCRGSCSSPCRRSRRREDSTRPMHPARSGSSTSDVASFRFSSSGKGWRRSKLRRPPSMCATGRRSVRPIVAPSTVVMVSPWTSTSGLSGAGRSACGAACRAGDAVGPDDSSRASPGCPQLTRRSRPPAPRAEPEVGLPQPELVQEARDLLDLLPGRREHVAMPALARAGAAPARA